VKISIIETKEDLTKFVEMAQRDIEITITRNEVDHKEIVYNKYYVNKITPLYCVFY